jgi:AAA domain
VSLDTVRADEIRFEAIDPMWRERIPRGMLCLVAGWPENGKGLFGAFLAAHVSRQRYKGADGKRRYGKVLYGTAEDSMSQMQGPRLKAAGARMGQIEMLRRGFSLRDDLGVLEEKLARGCDLLILDPIGAYVPSGYRHSDKIRTLLDPLTDLLEAYGTAAVVVDHVIKKVNRNASALSAVGGSSSGLAAASRTAFMFGKDSGDPDSCVLVNIKSGPTARSQAVRFSIDTETLEFEDAWGCIQDQDVATVHPDADEIDYHWFGLFDVAGDSDGRAQRTAGTIKWLVQYLGGAGKPVKVSQIHEDGKQRGMTRKMLRNAAESLGVVKDPPTGGRGCSWALPPSDSTEHDNVETTVTDDDIRKLMGDNDGK